MIRTPYIGLFILLILVNGVVAEVVITECVSANKTSLVDEDADSPDWIELHNTSTVPVDLTGWFLSDDTNDLTQWVLPQTNLATHGFLIVFASGKDRSIAGAELHSNFKLSAGGETIALTGPDGTTVEDSAEFPALDDDTAWGYGFIGGAPISVLDEGDPCAAHIPIDAADAIGWQNLAFDDSSWIHGTSAVGYETGTGYGPMIGLDVQPMKGSNESVYIRVPFHVGTASAANGMTLRMKYDDAFIAYVNGTPVAASDNAPSPITWSSGALWGNPDASAILYEDFNIDFATPLLVDGTNVLAIQAMNYLIDSSDLLITPRLEMVFDASLDTSTRGLLATPTPGASNTAIQYAGVVDTPSVFPERGFHDSAFSATISNMTEGATVRYTLDGSEPTESDPEYINPIQINSTTTLRVKAFKDGWRASWPRTDSYIFVDDVVLNTRSTTYLQNRDGDYQVITKGMDAGVLNETYHDASNLVVSVQDALKSIPTISITTDPDNLYGRFTGIYVNATQSWERAASVEWIDPAGRAGFHINAGLRIRGGFSRLPQFPKHGFRLFFRDAYGEGRLNYDFFNDGGITSFEKMDLRTTQGGNWASQGDARNTMLRDVFCRDAALAMGTVCTRSAYCHVYLNGEYWGLYMTEERPDNNFGADYFGGDDEDYDIVKVWRPYDNDPYDYGFWIEDPPPEGNLDAYRRLYDAAMAGFANNADYFAIQGLNALGEPDPNGETLADLDNMIDFLLLIYYAAGIDNGIMWWPGDRTLNNLYGLYNRTNPDGFKWIQHDIEMSLDFVSPEHLDRTGPFPHERFQQFKYFNPQTLHEKLSVNAEYRLKFADRVYKHFKGSGALTKDQNNARLDVRAAQIDRAIIAHSARWGNTSLDRDAWVAAVNSMRGFFARTGDRCDEVIGYLQNDGLIPSTAPPTIDQAGGLVPAGTLISISASAPHIYYTTNGIDPRAIGGAVAGHDYTGPIPITRPTQIKARAFNGSEWSALTEVTYWTEDIPLAVTELMYHAPDGNPHDFIEVKNSSAETVTMKGYKIDNAVDFKFKTGPATLAPGQHLVVVDDIDAFASTYPTNGVLIAGEFSGDFSNNGEKVDLEFRGGDLISFSYDDARNWPQAADGAGHSLIPMDAAMDDQERGSLDYGGNWRASTYTNGSPGFADPVPGATVLLNEVTAHTDTGLAAPYDSNDKIELYNPTAAAVNIGGWSLSDDRDDLNSFVIPGGTTISAGGFVVFDEDDFHTDRVNGFGLNKAGEQVYLTDPSRGVVDSIRFKGQENGTSYGRYPDGASDWLTTSPTLAAPNVPYAPPFQIAEVMYNPLPGEKEYIVIESLSDAAVPMPLFNATGPYRIDGGVAYGFPAGTTLVSGEKIWIVSFDPADTAQRAAFRAAYGLSGSDRVFGPWKGQLSNRGERVALERPQDSDDPARPWDISWVVVDELFYFNRAPWPESADGSGYPLVRLDSTTWSAPSATDSDADRMDDAWERAYFGSLEQADPDWDGDGQSNYDEFVADTNPTNPASLFVVEDMSGETLLWTAAPGRTYSVWWTDDLARPFVRIAGGLTAGGFTDIPRPGPCYYRVRVEL